MVDKRSLVIGSQNIFDLIHLLKTIQEYKIKIIIEYFVFVTEFFNRYTRIYVYSCPRIIEHFDLANVAKIKPDNPANTPRCLLRKLFNSWLCPV